MSIKCNTTDLPIIYVVKIRKKEKIRGIAFKTGKL